MNIPAFRQRLLVKLFVSALLFFAFLNPAAPQYGDRESGGNIELPDSLIKKLAVTSDDSVRIQLYESIGFALELSDIRAALKYDSAAILLANNRKWPWAQSRTLATLSSALGAQGKFAEALDALFRALEIAENNRLRYEIAKAYRRLGSVYFDMENFEKSVFYQAAALAMDKKIAGNDRTIARDHIDLAYSFERLNKPDSAIFYTRLALSKKVMISDLLQKTDLILGNVYFKKLDYDAAKAAYYSGLAACAKNADLRTSADINNALASLFSLTNKKDSALYCASDAFDGARKVFYKKGIITAGILLAGLYESSQPVRALKYYKTATAIKDSIFGIHNLESIQRLIDRNEDRRKQVNEERRLYQTRIMWYCTSAAVLVLLMIASVLYRNNREKLKANILLSDQKQKLEHAMDELKATQSQLIQAEKMASLGELTAGIAHEIQNPLNFVNNFSEVNKELAEELKQELASDSYRNGNLQLATEIVNDIKDNSEKINYHGKRADAIVKGMLQHSRSGSGQKEPTDLNALCDEYLRLSYHGIRAKKSSFNAVIKTDFDNRIGEVNVIAQDWGRVLLNLYNNAFYAVNEKQKQKLTGYEPTVSVSTKKTGDRISIHISDNGNGIPQNLIDKIFQPFFTTKPTGQGTGLGLSLVYDIVKTHGGQITVDTKEGEGSAFTISLPVDSL